MIAAGGEPIVLATTTPPPPGFTLALGAAPFVVEFGPVESRAGP